MIVRIFRITQISIIIFFGLGENNIYLNTTFRKRTASDWNWFIGTAYSFYDRKVKGAVKDRDVWNERQQEFHLKAKFFKLFTSRLRLDMGVETFVRSYRNHYQLETLRDMHQMYPTIYAGFLFVCFFICRRILKLKYLSAPNILR